MKVISKRLPGNSNLAMTQAAATPKTRFSGTAISAVIKVSLMAAQASAEVSAAR